MFIGPKTPLEQRNSQVVEKPSTSTSRCEPKLLQPPEENQSARLVQKDLLEMMPPIPSPQNQAKTQAVMRGAHKIPNKPPALIVFPASNPSREEA